MNVWRMLAIAFSTGKYSTGARTLTKKLTLGYFELVCEVVVVVVVVVVVLVVDPTASGVDAVGPEGEVAGLLVGAPSWLAWVVGLMLGSAISTASHTAPAATKNR